MAKRGVGDHPKTLELAEQLGIPVCYAVGVLELFWHWVAKQKPHGDLSEVKPAAIAHGIRFPGTGIELVEALTVAGFIDRSGERVLVHDWSEHADNAVHAYLKKRNEKFADGRPPFARNRPVEEREDREVHEPFVNQSRPVHALRGRTRPEPDPVPVPVPEPKFIPRKPKEPRWAEILDAFRLLLPPHLSQSRKVDEALRRFAEYAQQRQLRRWPKLTIVAKTEEVSRWSEAELVASVDKCIRNNYGSLPPPDGSRHQRKTRVDDVYEAL